jgi:AcrR family transcriptional regulator
VFLLHVSPHKGETLLVTEVHEVLPGGSSLLRNEPVQARSSARLTGLLDAAAAIIDDIGFERLTTAMVAERAGASIGTVYRYFPDRIAVVEALSVRSAQRLAARIMQSLETAESWVDVADRMIESSIHMYRTEPGFRAIRFGDQSDQAERHDDVEGRNALPGAIAGVLAERFGIETTPAVSLALSVSIEVGAGLIAFAFTSSRTGDEKIIDECRSIVKAYLQPVLG